MSVKTERTVRERTTTGEELTHADRVAWGKDARALTPPESHVEFTPDKSRDPVGLLLEQAKSRVPTVTAQSESLSGAGTCSLEVRWIFRGQLADAVAAWFERFPAEMTAVEDAYLLEPYLPGLSVKVRGGRALEVKVYQRSPGLLDAAGRACGRVESWKKWSFPHGPATQSSGNSAGWRPVSKRRRISWFSLAGEPFPPGVHGLGEEPRCAVELTEARVGRGAWWTLGFEATGPAGLQRSGLEAAAAVVFAQALPCGVVLGLEDSMSYAQWLRSRPAAGSDTEA
jgi:hypothetical protein